MTVSGLPLLKAWPFWSPVYIGAAVGALQHGVVEVVVDDQAGAHVADDNQAAAAVVDRVVADRVEGGGCGRVPPPFRRPVVARVDPAQSRDM